MLFFIQRRFPLAGAMLLALCLLLTVRTATAQKPASAYTQKAGRYQVELRVPAEGLFADEETDMEARVTDVSQDDPVQGAPPVVNAKLSVRVTMPSMAAMPAQSPSTHAEGVPGDYGIVLDFPHGGDFRLDLTVTPPNDKPFTVSFTLPVGDARAAKIRKAKPKPYTLEVTSVPATPRAGEPADLTILIRSRDTRQAVSVFDTVHERQIHFMVVSSDLSRFAHEHPVSGLDGKFTLRYTFPTGGEYHLFADVAPKNAGSQILMQPIRVAGTVPVTTTAAPFVPSLTAATDGVKLALATAPETLPVGRGLPITFLLTDAVTGEPITDLQPWLGAMAHLMLIQQDGVTFVHSHPDESDPTNGHKGSLTFLARFPKPGFYRAWLQFQRAGQVHTAAFTWEVGGTHAASK